MNDDLISRKALKKVINEYIDEYSDTDNEGNHCEKWCAMKEAEMAIDNASPVDIKPNNVAYICDGKKCPEEKASCLKGGPCHHTTDIDHAINFERIECGEKKSAKYFEHEHKFEGKADE